MNVFKLLSRNSKAPQATPAQRLPSSGAAANPQLFGQDEEIRPTESVKKNRKRKRGQDTSEPISTLPADLDFFGGASTASIPPENKHEKNTRVEDARLDIHEDDIKNAEEECDEDECKRVLRTHKLKITILEDFAPPLDEEPGKKKKKSKKRKREREEFKDKERKKDKRQLFPQPLTSFSQLRSRFGISGRLAQNIQEQGYKMPTEVQLGALPLLLETREKKKQREDKTTSSSDDVSGADISGNLDLLTVAPTGSGKTIAFLIPIINALLSKSDKTNTDQGPQAVVIAPTRELASQIVNEARKLGKGTGIKAALMKKGMELIERPEGNPDRDPGDLSEASDSEASSLDEDRQQPKRKKTRADIVRASILVATPLALLNALKIGNTVSPLPSIQHLVLDEADVLLDPLFREQTLSVWNACTNPHLRIGLWSATMGSNIEALAIDSINLRWKSISMTTPIPRRRPLVRLVVGLKDTAIPNITHKLIYAATEQGKLLGLRQLLHPSSSASSNINLLPPFLIFTQTIPRATALHSELLYDIPLEAGGSSRIAVLHADLSSSAREAIMTRFRRGEIWILITTDLLARGVDFRGLNGVVNYDVPNSAAAYVHRVGRTGRAGREGGVAVTFYTEEDIPHVKNVANVIKASERIRGKADGEGVQQWLLDALPTPSKRDKQQLKKRGVEARRNVKGTEGKGGAKMRISTKSGWERRREGNLRGAKMASRRREMDEVETGGGAASESEFEGFGE